MENKIKLLKELLESFKSEREVYEPFVMSFEDEIDDALEWAIEQVERVQELERELEEHKSKFTVKYTMSLREQNKRYREALEYIADNKIEHGWNLKAVNCVVRARRALEGEE